MALENKLGLTNDAELAREEERISKTYKQEEGYFVALKQTSQNLNIIAS